jgi:hypothetical protein
MVAARFPGREQWKIAIPRPNASLLFAELASSAA